MNKTLSSFPLFGALSLIFALGACSSSVKRVDLPATTSPTAEIQTLENEISEGYQNHLDVLAKDDFEDSQDNLNKAKEQVKDGKDQQKVLKSLGYARAHLDRARATGEARREKVKGLLEARSASLNAGVRDLPKRREELKDVDDDAVSLVRKDEIDPNEFDKLQRRYLQLEAASIQDLNLNDARAKIAGAKDQKAKKLAPKTLRQAEIHLKNAENVVAQNHKDQAAYQGAVDQANASAGLLVAVIAEQKNAKEKLDEDVALNLVSQKRQIETLGQSSAEAQAKVRQQGERIKTTEDQLKTSAAAVRLQKALDSARGEFSPQEAEVFQQGGRLLIRLKAMHFPVGSAGLPEDSLSILTKVTAIAEELNPKEVVVEGHTDATGTHRINRELSQKRADTVAQYLKQNGISESVVNSVGYADERPISSNKSKIGRSENRRVDIWIVPDSSEIPQTGQPGTTN